MKKTETLRKTKKTIGKNLLKNVTKTKINNDLVKVKDPSTARSGPLQCISQEPPDQTLYWAFAFATQRHDGEWPVPFFGYFIFEPDGGTYSSYSDEDIKIIDAKTFRLRHLSGHSYLTVDVTPLFNHAIDEDTFELFFHSKLFGRLEVLQRFVLVSIDSQLRLMMPFSDKFGYKNNRIVYYSHTVRDSDNNVVASEFKKDEYNNDTYSNPYIYILPYGEIKPPFVDPFIGR